MSRLRAVVIMSILTVAASGCSPGEELTERILESQEGVGDVEVDEESGQVRIEGEDGSISVGGGEVPKGFPIPIVDGADVQAVIQQGTEASVSLSVDDDFESVRSFYEDHVGELGEVTNTIETTNPLSVSWSIEAGSRTMAITIADAGPSVQVTLYSMGD